MRPLHLSALPALLALALLGACRDASESLVGPPPDAAAFVEFYPSYNRGQAMDVNDSSVAVGWMEENRAIRWPRGGRLQNLGTLGGNFSSASFINSAGHVAGVSSTPDGKHHVFLWTPAGGMRSLGTLGGYDLSLAAFSDSGHVAGWGTAAGGGGGFVVRQGSPLWTIDGVPAGVNSAGLVVGTRNGSPFLWTASAGMQPLPEPWGSRTWGTPHVNEAGMVAGIVTTGGVPHVVRWSASGGYQSLDGCGTAAPGCTMGSSLALNGEGAVAWSVWTPFAAGGGAYGLRVWEPGGAVREAPVAVQPGKLLLGEDGKVAGSGAVTSIFPIYRTFLWRPSAGVEYYRSSSQVNGMNEAGDMVGVTRAYQPGRPHKPWKGHPTWFGDPENRAPTVAAGAGGPYEVQAGVPLHLDAAQLASDPDGDSLQAFWSELNTCCTAQSARRGGRSTVTFQWNVPGEYDIALAVTDPDSLYVNARTRVRVLPGTGGPMTRGPYAATAGQYVQLDGRRADDPAGTRYAYFWSIDFGGFIGWKTALPWEARAVLSKRFDWAGTFPLTLTVRDWTGGLVEYVRTQAVITPHPGMSFHTASPLPEGTPIQLVIQGFKLGRSRQLQVSYNCGDGVFGPWQYARGDGVVSHACPGLPAGQVTVGARRRELSGPTLEYTREVTLTPGPPGVALDPVGREFFPRAQSASARLSIVDTHSDGPWSYTVRWGDGTVTEGTTQTATPIVLSHTYASAGQFRLQADVSDRTGATTRFVPSWRFWPY